MSTFCSHHHISNSAILAKGRSYTILFTDMRTEWQESPAFNVIVNGKIYLCVRNHLHILKTSIRKEIQQIQNLYGDTVTCTGLAFRRKNLLSSRQMSPNRTSVQPFIIACFTYRNRQFQKREVCLVGKHWKWLYLGVRSRAITISLQCWATNWRP
jgi:hypothetical protein